MKQTYATTKMCKKERITCNRCKEELRTAEKYFLDRDSKFHKLGIKYLNMIFGSEVRIAIVYILKYYNKSNLNKSDLHNLLKEAEIKISYKNLLWNLDKLEKAEIILFERDKNNNNSVYVKLNNGKINKLLKLTFDSLEYFKGILLK